LYTTMRYINRRFTYLLTYLLSVCFSEILQIWKQMAGPSHKTLCSIFPIRCHGRQKFYTCCVKSHPKGVCT